MSTRAFAASQRTTSPEPVAYFVRHGQTKLNNGKRFRGFMDVELDDQGRQDAAVVRNLLADVAFVTAYSSDLKRAAETLDIIMQGRPPLKDTQRLAALRPWNVGDFAGHPKDAKGKAALQEYANSPKEPVPNGESLFMFRSRYGNVFADILDHGAPALVVQHASNNHEVGNIVYGDIDALDVEPGGVIAIYRDGNKLTGKIIHGQPEHGAGMAS